jgi:hypothetical protein
MRNFPGAVPNPEHRSDEAIDTSPETRALRTPIRARPIRDASARSFEAELVDQAF